MGFTLYIALIVITIAIISWRWVEGIDYMSKNHPDYKGDELFGKFDEEDEKHIG